MILKRKECFTNLCKWYILWVLYFIFFQNWIKYLKDPKNASFLFLISHGDQGHRGCRVAWKPFTRPALLRLRYVQRFPDTSSSHCHNRDDLRIVRTRLRWNSWCLMTSHESQRGTTRLLSQIERWSPAEARTNRYRPTYGGARQPRAWPITSSGAKFLGVLSCRARVCK